MIHLVDNNNDDRDDRYADNDDDDDKGIEPDGNFDDGAGFDDEYKNQDTKHQSKFMQCSTFSTASNFEYNFIIKKLAKEFENKFERLGENYE